MQALPRTLIAKPLGHSIPAYAENRGDFGLRVGISHRPCDVEIVSTQTVSFSKLRIFLPVLSHVLRLCQHLQVGRFVVLDSPVAMVNNLRVKQGAPKSLFCYQAMLQDISIFANSWMLRHPDQSISLFGESKRLSFNSTGGSTAAPLTRAWIRAVMSRVPATLNNVERLTASSTFNGDTIQLHFWSLLTGSGVSCRGWLQPRSGLSCASIIPQEEV